MRFLAALLVMALPFASNAQEVGDAWPARIVNAGVSGDRLWIGRDDHTLSSYDLNGGDRRDEATGVRVVASSDSSVWTIPAGGEPVVSPATIRFTDARSNATLPALDLVEGEGFIALVTTTPRPIAVSTNRLFVADGQGWSARPLSKPIRPGFRATATLQGDGNALFVGFANGEWGGALHRVDMNTGRVDSIESRESEDLCAGPLNPSCDPITALVPDAQRPECVIAAIGLEHLGSRNGRVLRVCGTDVSWLFARRTRILFSARVIDSLPIYGLVNVRGATWVLSRAEAFRIVGDDVVETLPIQFQPDGDMRVSRPNDDIMFVTGSPLTRRTITGAGGRQIETVMAEQEPLIVLLPAGRE